MRAGRGAVLDRSWLEIGTWIVSCGKRQVWEGLPLTTHTFGRWSGSENAEAERRKLWRGIRAPSSRLWEISGRSVGTTRKCSLISDCKEFSKMSGCV